MSLLEKMKKAGSIKNADTLSESAFFNAKDVIPTDLPILNVAFSGDIQGGLVSGLTILAGESKSYKTLLSLYCLRAYMQKYPDAVCLFYDSEFGVTPEYLKANEIDAARVLHIPIEHVEQLKFDIVKRLEQINRGDKVFVLIDSLGALASKKEVDDAIDEKSVADMSRAKAIRSLLRIITPHLTMKDIPCMVINHVYQTMEMFSKTVIPGGTSVTYSANQIFVITRSQEKSGTDLVGYNFTINIEKSRFVREKSKLKFLVTFEGGIYKHSGLLDLALESGNLIQSGAWYQTVNADGEIAPKKIRGNDIPDEFWEGMKQNKKFQDFVRSKYKLAEIKMLDDSEINEVMEAADE